MNKDGMQELSPKALKDAAIRVGEMKEYLTDGLLKYARLVKAGGHNRDSLKEWAQRADVTASNITNLLNGKPLKIDQILKLGKAVQDPNASRTNVLFEFPVFDEQAQEMQLLHPLVGKVASVFDETDGAIRDVNDLETRIGKEAYARCLIFETHDFDEFFIKHKGEALAYAIHEPRLFTRAHLTGPSLQNATWMTARLATLARGDRVRQTGRPHFAEQNLHIEDGLEMTRIKVFLGTFLFSDPNSLSFIVTVSERALPD